MASKALITSFLKLVAVAACVAAVALPAQAGSSYRPLTAAALARTYAAEPIPPQYDPARHAMPSNVIIRNVSYSDLKMYCGAPAPHTREYGCVIYPTVQNAMTYFFIIMDRTLVGTAYYAPVLRHEKAHVLGWRH